MRLAFTSALFFVRRSGRALRLQGQDWLASPLVVDVCDWAYHSQELGNRFHLPRKDLGVDFDSVYINIPAPPNEHKSVLEGKIARFPKKCSLRQKALEVKKALE